MDMNFLKSIFKYFNNKLIYLILIVGLPAILAGFCITGSGLIEIIVNYNRYQFTGFVGVYVTVLGRTPLWLYIQPVALIGLALGMSLLYATVDSHMRMGEFSIRNVVRKLDYNFIACAKYVLVLAIAGHIMVLLASLLTFAFYKVSMSNVALGWTLSAICIFILAFLYLCVIVLTILWLPTMLHTGASDNRAFVMAVKQIAPHFMKTLNTLVIPLVPYFLLMVLNCYFNWNLAIVFDVLCFVFFAILLVVTMNTLYYDLNSIEREDLKSIIWSKNIRR